MNKSLTSVELGWIKLSLKCWHKQKGVDFQKCSLDGAAPTKPLPCAQHRHTHTHTQVNLQLLKATQGKLFRAGPLGWLPSEWFSAGGGFSINSYRQTSELCPLLPGLSSQALGGSSPVITHHRLHQPAATLITLLSVICLNQEASFCLTHKRLLLKEICNSASTSNCLFVFCPREFDCLFPREVYK